MVETVCLFEDPLYPRLYPLSLTRPVYELRCGIFSLREKLFRLFPQARRALLCRPYLAELVAQEHPDCSVNAAERGACLFLNGRLLASDAVRDLAEAPDTLFFHGDDLAAACLSADKVEHLSDLEQGDFDPTKLAGVKRESCELEWIRYPWDLVQRTPAEIASDFRTLGEGGRGQGIVSEHAVRLNPKAIYVGPGAEVKPGVVLDATHGPIYVGENAVIMANAVIEGPAFIGAGSTIKIGAKIYEGTSIGARCKVGGEVEASIIHSYSNKQHDGFLGHAYLGQWVNLGADTNNSDLKNNYGTVKVTINGEVIDTGLQFVGLFMGDHSKSGINTMFNTGTVVGVMSNVFGAGFPPKEIPSFAWGGADGFVPHDLDKALQTARTVMARRDVELTPAHEKVYRHVYDLTVRQNPKSPKPNPKAR